MEERAVDEVLKTRETLLTRVRNRDDKKSWEEFVRYYGRYIYNVVRRMNLSHHDAEDIVQTVNLKLWNELPKFRYDATKGRFRSWLCTVAANEARMFLRRKERALRHMDPARREELRMYLKSVEFPEIERLAEREWAAYVMNLAWRNIRDCFESQVKEAFERVSQGEKPEDVAANLGLSTSSVYVYKKRVQDRLRAEAMRLNRELD
jgi:RNA polymerase sigma factor (sigma-70 family)